MMPEALLSPIPVVHEVNVIPAAAKRAVREASPVDAVGCVAGDWVICVGSSAAREAAGSKDFPSDLTIVGIIDHWSED